MELRIRSEKTVIIPLDREGLEALLAGDCEKVCGRCAAAYNEDEHAFFASLAAETPFAEDFAEEDIHWNTVWVGVRKKDGSVIGAIRMMGNPTEKHELTMTLFPRVGFDDPAFAKMFARVCEWAFSHRVVYYLRVTPGDEQETALLRSYGFAPHETDGLFEREKNRPAWMLICLCIGLGTGVVMGDVFGSNATGMAVGALFGVFIGFLLDHQDISRRKL